MHLNVQGLWEAVTGTKINMEKDRLALSAMLAAILESSGVQLDIKKLAKVNWEIIRSFLVGIVRSNYNNLERGLMIKKLSRNSFGRCR